jgi:hypothetical protein
VIDRWLKIAEELNINKNMEIVMKQTDHGESVLKC